MLQSKIFTIIVLLISFGLWGQEKMIQGNVTDVRGVPLPGATVQVKSTANGTQTDFDGTYRIRTEVGDILIFSFIGFASQEVSVTKDISILNVQLQEQANALEEVVVTALGITKAEKKIGYSTQKLETNTIEEIPVSNIGNLFSGQIAGLSVKNPTGMFQAPSFSLRGKSPLIVVDNIPVETDFNDISPQDIASINVLKGTTASALYGSKGRNGAILITTKNASKEGLQIQVSQNVMITAGFSVYPETQTQYGNGSNGKYEFWDGRDGGVSDGDMIWGPKFESGVMIPQWNSPIRDKISGKITPWWGDVSGTKYDDKSRYERVPIPWEYHDNLGDFLQTGYISTTNFSIGDKSEKGSYRFAADYTYQKDKIPNSSLKRGGLSFKSSVNLNDDLILDAKISYNKVYSPNYPRYGYGPKNHMYTILIWMGNDVNGQDLKNHLYVPGLEGYRQANYNYAWYNNVYFAANELTQTCDSNLLNGQLSLSYDITKRFSIKGKGSGILKKTFEDRKSPKSYLNYGDPRDGDYKTWNKSRLTVDFDILATYNFDIGKNIKFNTNAGAATYYRDYHEEYNATDGLIEPYIYSLNNTKGNIKGKTYVRKKQTNGVYATIETDLYNTFFLSLAGRNDWSSTLPKQNSSYFYPSVSMSTIISNIISLPHQIDYLKVFTSWAEVSSDLEPYQILSYYETANSFNGNPKMTYPGVLVNPNIKPEKSTSFELGLSTSFFSRRLNFDLTYYNVLDENQIIDLPISLASAFTNRKVNGNEYITRGWELVLSSTPIKTDNFTWKSVFNWSRRVQRLTKIYGDQNRYGKLYLNDRVDSYYDTVWQKSADGKLILDDKGLPTRDPYPAFLGYLNPDWSFGFQNTFNYNKWSLSVGIDGVWGGVIRSLTVEKMWWGGKHPYSVEYRDAEYAAGKPIYVPEGVNVISGELKRDIDGNIISDTRKYKKNTTALSWQTWSQNYPYEAKVTQKENEKFANVFDRSFVKLRTVALKYDLTSLVNKKNISKLDISLTGYNLLVWKKADFIDPDFGDDNNLQDPSSRYIGMGININF